MTENTPQAGSSPSRQDFERDVVARARADADFRRQLLADPRAAIKAVYGFELPPEVELQVLQETPSRFYLVLPPETEELTDDQLAAVAGGAGSEYILKQDLTAAAATFMPVFRRF